MDIQKNVIKHNFTITKADRIRKGIQKPVILWLTGLSGSGKSTIANQLEEYLFSQGHYTYILDGDNVRQGLNKDLTFSDEDRQENIRRIGEVAKLFVDAGAIVITTFISPFREDRDAVRNLVERGEFIEVYIKTPLLICEKRDIKGLYQKARNGEINNFTGINSPYEPPEKPEIVVDTTKFTVQESAMRIFQYLLLRGIIQDKRII